MIISPDNHIYIDGKYVWTPERASAAWKKAYEELEAALKNKNEKLRLLIGIGTPGSGKSTYIAAHQKNHSDYIYFDATFCNKRSRKEIIRRAKYHKIPIDAVFLDTPFDICLERNSKRPEDRRVPKKTMEAMFDKLSPPEYSEGFSHIIIVEYTN